MKQKGGVPPAFQRRTPSQKLGPPSLPPKFRDIVPFPTPPPSQTPSIMNQLVRPRSPFTGPGPSTAGRKKHMRRRTRKVKH